MSRVIGRKVWKTTPAKLEPWTAAEAGGHPTWLFVSGWVSPGMNVRAVS